MADHAFWIDWEHDREAADSGTRSRYGSYLYQRARLFADLAAEAYDDPTVEFARLAWYVANGPVMAPPLVRWHPRVLSAEVQRSDWNGKAVAVVGFAVPRPRELADVRPPDGGWYGDWRADSSGRYEGVGGREIERRPYLLTEARVAWQLPDDALPRLARVPVSSQGLLDDAATYVTALVDALNRGVDPLLARL